ncbi:hypothetical protein LINPERPRIM_LOCUS38037 [Linum perenne]
MGYYAAERVNMGCVDLLLSSPWWLYLGLPCGCKFLVGMKKVVQVQGY